MSWASKNIFDPLMKAFDTAVAAGGAASTPAAAQVATAAGTAKSALGQAATAVEGATDSLADIGVNFILSLVPGGGTFDGLADDVVNAAINKLAAKLSTPSTVTVTPVVPV